MNINFKHRTPNTNFDEHLSFLATLSTKVKNQATQTGHIDTGNRKSLTCFIPSAAEASHRADKRIIFSLTFFLQKR